MATPNFTVSSSATASDINLSALVENLLIVLNEKEKHIIERRFALHQKKKQTLEEIGQKFSVTRERIRQIEKNALKKLTRNAQNTNIRILNEYAKAVIEKHAGIMTEDKLLATILNNLKNISATEVNELRLALTLDNDIEKIPNTINYEPNWRLTKIPFQLVKEVTQVGTKVLNENGDVMAPIDIAKKVIEKLGEKVPAEFIVNTMEIDKRVKVTDKGLGLKIWRHINPRTLRDKISFILEREQKPLHFVKISNLISESSFDKKTVNTQAVHNELIRNDDFILIGRGIYALSKWGYKSGTVADVIEKILAGDKTMSREEIIKEVLKQRQVKTITIYLNLKNKKQFKRVGRDSYKLEK
ncbi:MAG: RNA polymerase sigma factor [uncultured bacterium]|nr:MAG: RNA polymerase sigma factor [uncultured bacterium]